MATPSRPFSPAPAAVRTEPPGRVQAAPPIDTARPNPDEVPTVLPQEEPSELHTESPTLPPTLSPPDRAPDAVASAGAAAPRPAPSIEPSGRSGDAARRGVGTRRSADQTVLEAQALQLLGDRPVLVLALQFSGAFGLALLALWLSRAPGHIAMLWYPNAWGACFLIFAPRRHWPTMLAVQGGAITLANLVFGAGPGEALAFLPANLVESLLSAWWLSGGGAYRQVQSGPWRCGAVLLLGGVAPAAVGACLGTLLLALQGLGAWQRVGPTWFTSSLLGSVALLPLGLALLSSTRAQLRRALPRETWPLALLSLGVAMVVLPQLPFPFIYLVLPLTLAAMTLPFIAVSLLVLLVSLTVGTMVAFALLPVPAWTALWQPVLLYLPLLAAQLPPLLLASSVSESRRQHEVLQRSRERLRALYEGTPAMMMSLGPDGRIFSVSGLWLERLGWRREEVLGRLMTDFFDEPLRQRALEVDLPLLLEQGAGRDLEYRMIARDGTRLEVLVAATCEYDEDGVPVRLHAVLEDITRKRLAEQLAIEHARSRVTLESVADAVITTDASGRIEYLNPVATVQTGWRLSEVRGRLYGEVLQRRDVDSGAELPDPVALCLHQRERPMLPHTVMLHSRHGGAHPIHESVAPMVDGAGALIGAVATFQDVTQAHALAVRLAHQAQHDGLTGLPNRLLLQDRLHQCLQLARRNGSLFALLFMDLDHFKRINDDLGHAVGDELLRQVAQRILTVLRASDTACRLGGDEFVVLLPQIDRHDDAAVAARHVLNEVLKPYPIDGQLLHASFSIGVAVFPDDGDDEDELLRCADSAMYQAKQGGRNRIVCPSGRRAGASDRAT
jgi:diguanylate cyclase (GGDEF)-like protein/PAS domain S-box-containing protein